jgi:O-acetylhomoserine (thiol)-lyase
MASDLSSRRPALETLLVHGAEPAGREGPTLPPIFQSTAFAHGSAAAMERVFLHQQEGDAYSRLGNPTVAALEERVSAVCNARGTVAVASGMSAIALALLALLKTGDRVLVSRHLFGGTYQLFQTTLRRLGIEPVWFDPQDPASAQRAAGPQVKAVFLEAIANPAMTVPDLAAYRELCDRAGIPLLLDATLLTPLVEVGRLGADVALYSGSKYLAGAASTIGGLIVDTGRTVWPQGGPADLGDFHRAGADAFLMRLRRELMAAVGPALSPHTAFLQLVGLETLALRLERQCATAAAIATRLGAHPRVRGVLYPGLPDSPDHDRCRRQFGRFGSVLGLTLADRAACFRFLDALRLVRLASNLGDTKTLALHPASTIYGSLWPAEREHLGVTEDLIRLSLGIEAPEDILADLEQALEA